MHWQGECSLAQGFLGLVELADFYDSGANGVEPTLFTA
jgi:hypothetical protein